MKILVIGETCIDRYIYGGCKRLCPEGPVPVMNPESIVEYEGMAGNTYANIKAMCNPNDVAVLITQNQNEVSRKTRYIHQNSNQILLRVDEQDEVEHLSTTTKLNILSQFARKKVDLLIISDYCKGFLDEKDLVELAAVGEISILDTKKRLTDKVVKAFDFVKLNEHEYHKNEDIINHSISNVLKTIITKGSKGVVHNRISYPPPKVYQTFDVSGAGDVFTAGFGYNLALGHSISDSISVAQSYCSQVIQKRGTCVYEKNMD